MKIVVCPLPVKRCIAPIDTTAMELRLLSDKIAKATTLVDDMVKRCKIQFNYHLVKCISPTEYTNANFLSTSYFVSLLGTRRYTMHKFPNKRGQPLRMDECIQHIPNVHDTEHGILSAFLLKGAQHFQSPPPTLHLRQFSYARLCMEFIRCDIGQDFYCYCVSPPLMLL